MGFISRIQERQAEITAEIAELVAERDENDAALRALVRLGFVDDASKEDRPGPPVDDEPGDTSGTMSDVSAAMNTLLGDTPPPVVEQSETRKGELGESPDETARSGEDQPGAQVLSNKSHATGKPGAAASDKAAPAPSIASRLRTLNAEHPEYTIDQAADALGIPREKARSNSNVNRIRWARAATAAPKQRATESQGLQERVRDTHYRHRDWSDDQIAAHVGCGSSYVRTVAQRLGLTLASRRAPQKAVEPAPVPDEPSPAPEPESQPAVTPEPANEASGAKYAAISGKRFWLVNDAGLYLNRFGTGFTADRRNAWDGNERQLIGIRKSYLIARDLREKPVTREQSPVPVNREGA